MRHIRLGMTAMLAAVGWSQGVQTNTASATVYQIKPATQVSTLSYGDEFKIKLDRSQPVAAPGPISVRIFEGPRDKLADPSGRISIGDCIRYEPLISTHAIIDRDTLEFPNLREVSDLWISRDGQSRKFVLVPEDGRLVPGTVWLNRSAVADYFNRGIEVEVTRGRRPIPPAEPAQAPAPPTASTSTGSATATTTPVGPMTIQCVQLGPAQSSLLMLDVRICRFGI